MERTTPSKKSRKLLDRAGQSTIEFALTLMLMMGFILFFTQASFLFAYGNLVHYATFMSARAYLSAGESIDDQKERAKDVIITLLKKSAGQTGVEKYSFIAQGDNRHGGDSTLPGAQIGPHAQFQPKDKTLSWMQGVRYTFTGKLTSVPFGGTQGGVNTLTLDSESWLGREHDKDECLSVMGGKVLDNGC